MKLIGQTQRERGRRGEEIASQVLSQLKKDGYLREFWIIPSLTRIDRMGVDVICQKSGEESGYYLINVKSSWGGVLIFLEKQRLLMLDLPEKTLRIYPLLVRPGEDPAVIRNRLFSEIFNLEPSCEVLPEKIQKGLDDLANSPAILNENQLRKKNSDQAKEQSCAEENEKILEPLVSSISSRQKIRNLREVAPKIKPPKSSDGNPKEIRQLPWQEIFDILASSDAPHLIIDRLKILKGFKHLAVKFKTIKLGKFWLINCHCQGVRELNASVVIRDAQSQEEGKERAFQELINQLRRIAESTP